MSNVTICFFDAERDIDICVHTDDIFMWFKRWDIYAFDHMLNSFLIFFILSFNLGGKKRYGWSIFVSGLIVWSFGWLYEMIEELTFTIDSTTGDNVTLKEEWESGDSLIGDPIANALGIIAGITFQLVFYKPFHMNYKPDIYWLKYFVQAIILVLVGPFGLRFGKDPEDLFDDRRTARSDWIGYVIFQMFALLFLLLWNRLDIDDLKRTYGTVQNFYDIWLHFILIVFLAQLSFVHIYTRPWIMMVIAASVLALASIFFGIMRAIKASYNREQQMRKHIY